ncbi:alpha-2-macroglobulin-like [Discoglossus pictus]
MLPQALCVGLLLLQLSGALEAKLHYAVIFPSQIRSSFSELACIHLEGADGLARVQITLHLENKDIPLIEREIQQDAFFTCTPFQVPPTSNGNDGVARLEVSIEGAGKNIKKTSNILVRKEKNNILIQTDKAVYKPGQTVKFRIVSLKENLQPTNEMIPVIELQDPQKNRIGQWLNVTSNQGIVDLSLPLVSEPTLGEYSIKVKDKVHLFTVEEYVLPRFEVTLEFQKIVLYSSVHIPVKVCGRYTYGKPVQGMVACKMCRKLKYSPYYYIRNSDPVQTDLCVSFTGKLDKFGCFTQELNSGSFSLARSDLGDELLGDANVTEDGTGILMSTSSKVRITSIINKVLFVDADSSYKPGIPYTGMVRVKDASDSPVPDTLVYLTGTKSDQVIINETLVTDESGYATFRLENTTSWAEDISLRATTSLKISPTRFGVYTPQHIEGHLNLSLFYSKRKNFMKVHSLQKDLPCEGEQIIQVEYFIQVTKSLKMNKYLKLHYMVVSKGTIQDSGALQISTESDRNVLHGEVSLKVQLSVNHSPIFNMLSYIFLPNGEIAADSSKFKVLRCFQNKVSISFSRDEALPGSDVFLRVQAAAGSLCALRVVDQSVVLMKPEAELTVDKVHDLFPSRGFNYRLDDYDSDYRRCYRSYHFLTGLPKRFHRRRPSFTRSSSPSPDVYNLFKGPSQRTEEDGRGHVGKGVRSEGTSAKQGFIKGKKVQNFEIKMDIKLGVGSFDRTQF